MLSTLRLHFQDIKSPLQTDFAVCDFYDGRRGISRFNLYIHLLLCLGPGKSMFVRRSKSDNKIQSQLSVSISFYSTALTSLTTGPGEVMHWSGLLTLASARKITRLIAGTLDCVELDSRQKLWTVMLIYFMKGRGWRNRCWSVNIHVDRLLIVMTQWVPKAPGQTFFFFPHLLIVWATVYWPPGIWKFISCT